jgi:sarcosine oxidase
MHSHYDLIIIGLGAMGSAALYQAAKRGVSVLGIDRYDPPHTMGSSHAETRITRLALGEGMQYMPWVARSNHLWRELEAATGEALLYLHGGLIITSPSSAARFRGQAEDFAVVTQKIAAAHGIDHAMWSGAEVRKSYPQILARDSDHAYYEPTGGFILAEKAVAVQLAEAQKQGATMRPNEPVTRVDWSADSVTVTTATETFAADRAIVTTGAWISDFVPEPQRRHFPVYRQVVYWFEVEDPAVFAIDRWPFVMWIGDTTEAFFTSFAIVQDGVPGLKMVTEQHHTPCDPDTVGRDITADEIARYYDTLASDKLAGIKRRCLAAEACLYTVTADEHFVIDRHPETDLVIVASPCSGHGFKHSAAIGEALVEMALEGTSQLSTAPFAFRRLHARGLL